jgi:multiple sugar transport system permease protein
MHGKRNLIKAREARCAYLFIAPLIAGLLLFSAWPIAHSFYMSLMKWDGLGVPKMIGLKNYVNLFSDPKFWMELNNTLVFAAGTIPLTVFFSLLTAVLLNKPIRARTLYRTVYFLPNVTMVVAVAVVWRSLLNSQYGVWGALCSAFGLEQINILGNTSLLMFAIIMVSVWCNVGYNTVILLAGLQGIPRELYEAAELDGAKGLNLFRHITIPMLSPTLFFVITMLVINSLKTFDLIYMFVGAYSQKAQGPLLNSVRTIVYGIYEKAFSTFKMGYASAEAVVLFALIMLITFVQMKGQKRWVHYE